VTQGASPRLLALVCFVWIGWAHRLSRASERSMVSALKQLDRIVFSLDTCIRMKMVVPNCGWLYLSCSRP
jgi:hypothetical protein